jgi:hypothetical protein
MMEKISQTLAGHIGTLSLLPFSASEHEQGRFLSEELDTALWQGAYPPIFEKKTIWLL